MPKLSHPGKILWPDVGASKQDLANYLIEAAPWMIAHVYGRPCSLVRAPEGVDGEIFFQRHAMPGRGQPGVATIEGSDEPYVQIDDAQSLVNLAQLSVVEVHPWNCAPFQPAIPGRLVFDLDPAPEVAFDEVIAAALELKDRLRGIGLIPFLKTTGGKGLHVVMPLEADANSTWRQAKLLAHTLCQQMVRDSPKKFVATSSKARRSGKIYLDYLRNDTKATAVAPLSPRARPGALVSMPLDWDQARKGLDPSRYSIRTAMMLLAKSKAWSDYSGSQKSLLRAVERLIKSAG
jgi:bifunctional non-homologous end joining protein LigD